MGRVVDWIQALALGLGAPGLFVAAFFDSSFLSLPEINDFLVIYMTNHNKSRMVLYASSATLGSLAGCLALYYVGHKGAGATARLNAASAERALSALRRHGTLAVLIPALLPPPAPFKVFVLLAGVAGISVSRFATAVAIGRGIRFFGVGFLAVRYGDAAAEYIAANGQTIAWGTVVLLLAILAGSIVWAKAQGRRR